MKRSIDREHQDTSWRHRIHSATEAPRCGRFYYYLFETIDRYVFTKVNPKRNTISVYYATIRLINNSRRIIIFSSYLNKEYFLLSFQ